MEFVPGDEAKDSLQARGLTFEMILEAIADGKTLDFQPSPTRPGQMLLIVEICGYVHVAACERRGHRWRIITAYPSRKHHKQHHP